MLSELPITPVLSTVRLGRSLDQWISFFLPFFIYLFSDASHFSFGLFPHRSRQTQQLLGLVLSDTLLSQRTWNLYWPNCLWSAPNDCKSKPDQSRTQTWKNLAVGAHLFGFLTYVDGVDWLLDCIIFYFTPVWYQYTCFNATYLMPESQYPRSSLKRHLFTPIYWCWTDDTLFTLCSLIIRRSLT